MRLPRRVQAVAVVLLLAGVAVAQKIPTGTLTGTVTDGQAPLPGATVTVTSPSQQGARVATSTVNGEYILLQLPPGPYAVRFELQGFQTIGTTVKISGDLTSGVDAVMPRVTTVAEEVTVTGRYETVSTTATNAATYESKLIQVLPVIRGASAYVDLAPGTVQLTGAPWYHAQIAGAPSYESLNLINGAVANDNIGGGYMLPVYIEDAIQETTISQANISAEYGRFTGGVVSMLTKSGGNEFHGSLRLNLTNPSWTASTPLTVAPATDKIDQQWEGTLGGYLLRDRLWFFLGGRTATATTPNQTAPPVSIPYDTTITQDRYEGKLTLALSPSHRLIGSYLDIRENRENWMWGTYDLASVGPMKVPQSIAVLNYSGVLSNAFFVEGQYSARKKTQGGYGSDYTDFERGTPVVDMGNNWVPYNSPLLCAVCPDPDDHRDITDAFAKASAFISTGKAGSHDLRFGVDVFDDMRKLNNWQSGSGYVLFAGQVNIVGTGTSALYYPVILPDQAFLAYYQILQLSQGSHFKTYSAFVNDAWRLGNHLTFNLGVRYDKNNGTDASGIKVVTDGKWSPRLSVTWDPKGEGETQVTLGYAQYVDGIENSVAGSSAIGGANGEILFAYGGPPINAEGNEVETHEALGQVSAWLESIGGPMANPQLWWGTYVPGYQVFMGNDLRSPSTKQWALGVSQRLGSGVVRLDLLDKRWTDLYSNRTDMTTGHSEDPHGNVYDRIIVENDPDVRRRYQAAMVQGDYRFGERLHVGGNYTLSRLYGADCSYYTACTNGLDSYPEYRNLSWNAPEGDLGGDRRHKLNLYVSWDAVSSKPLALNLSALQRYMSGSPYGAWSCSVPVGPYVTNPGYVSPPGTNCYAFTAPDAYRTGGVASTDLAATLTFRIAGRIEVYINPQVQNVFNRQAAVFVDSTVYVNYILLDNLAPFNPFKDKPKECPQNTTCNLADGYNWQKAPDFGKPTWPEHYQTPRTFLVNVGLRF